MQTHPQDFTEDNFGKCPACGGALTVEGQDRVSGIDPEKLIGTSKALQPQSDDGRFATHLHCENGHEWWMLTEDLRESV